MISRLTFPPRLQKYYASVNDLITTSSFKFHQLRNQQIKLSGNNFHKRNLNTHCTAKWYNLYTAPYSVAWYLRKMWKTLPHISYLSCCFILSQVDRDYQHLIRSYEHDIFFSFWVLRCEKVFRFLWFWLCVLLGHIFRFFFVFCIYSQWIYLDSQLVRFVVFQP